MSDTTSTRPPGMSNCDGAIGEGLADYLKAGGLGAEHYAWNFCGSLSFRDGRFVEEVHRYHVLVGTVEADTLEDLMREVNDQFGWD